MEAKCVVIGQTNKETTSGMIRGDFAVVIGPSSNMAVSAYNGHFIMKGYDGVYVLTGDDKGHIISEEYFVYILGENDKVTITVEKR